MNLSIHTAPMFGRCHDTITKETRVRPAKPVKPVSCPFGPMAHPLELAACLGDFQLTRLSQLMAFLDLPDQSPKDQPARHRAGAA